MLTDTQAPGLRVISGASDLLSAANIKHLQKVRVMNQVRALDVDVVLIDLGAGTSYNILDFFLLSDVSILAVVPEPTSIENGYRFIKSALYRRLRAVAPTQPVRELLDSALDPKNPLGIKTPTDLLARVESDDAESARTLRREMAAFQPRFVVNEVRDTADVAIGHQLVAACVRHLGLRASYAGFVHHDDAVWRAVRRRRLFMSDAPTSRAAEEIRQLTRGLVKGESHGPWLLSPARRRRRRRGGGRRGDDLYAALGLEPRATSEQVERAYRFCLELYGEGAARDSTRCSSRPRPRRSRARVREAYEILSDAREAPGLRRGAGLPAARRARAARSRAGGRGRERAEPELPEVLTRRRPAAAARGARRVAAAHRVGHQDRPALPRVHRGGPLRVPARARLPARLPAGVRAARRHRPAPRRRRLHEPARAKR